MKKRRDHQKLAEAMGGLPVLGCPAGSPAALAGVRYGDVLLAINGLPTATAADYVRAREASGNHLELCLWREGEQIVVELDLTGVKPMTLDQVMRYVVEQRPFGAFDEEDPAQAEPVEPN